jgi:hypothetical protein
MNGKVNCLIQHFTYSCCYCIMVRVSSVLSSELNGVCVCKCDTVQYLLLSHGHE